MSELDHPQTNLAHPHHTCVLNPHADGPKNRASADKKYLLCKSLPRCRRRSCLRWCDLSSGNVHAIMALETLDGRGVQAPGCAAQLECVHSIADLLQLPRCGPSRHHGAQCVRTPFSSPVTCTSVVGPKVFPITIQISSSLSIMFAAIYLEIAAPAAVQSCYGEHCSWVKHARVRNKTNKHTLFTLIACLWWGRTPPQ